MLERESTCSDHAHWPVLRALSRARVAILTIALTYVLSTFTGAVMVHMGNSFALAYGDRLGARGHMIPPRLHFRKVIAWRPRSSISVGT